MGRFDGRVALITGGARGQGRSHAVHFAREGADVIITDICEQIPGVNYPLSTPEDLDETVALVEAEGRRCLAYTVDARDGVAMARAVDAAVAELGRLDSVVINHGIGAPHAADDRELFYVWDEVVSTNLSAVFKSAAVCIPHLRENGGSITMTGSASSFVAIYNNPSYTASKHGIIGLMKSLAADLAPSWIRVNAVCPTGVDTELYLNDFNAGRFNPGMENPTVEDMRGPATALNQLPIPWIEPSDVSKLVLFLASDDAKYMTGSAIPLDAGMSTQPPGITPYIGRLLWEASNS